MNENEMISSQPNLEIIMEKHDIDKERFVRGVIFAEYVVNGESANNAYTRAFECTRKEASTKSANFRNSKWIQELIIYFRPDENTLYFGEIRQIIRKGMNIIDDPLSEPKDIISAMNALSKYIKVNNTSQQEENILASDATKLMTGLIKGMEELANSNKMISGDGAIIDVPILR